MKAQYDQLLLASFRVWLDHTILSKGEAFSNQTLDMYEIDDPQYPSYDVYGAPVYQWVYDSSISGAQVPTGVVESIAGTVGRGTDGLNIDFENGRAVFESGHPGVTGMSVGVSVKEINTYVSTRSEQRLVNELKFSQDPDLRTPDGALMPNQVICPAVFVRLIKRENDPACLGGMDWTRMFIRCICFANDWQTASIGSILSDTKHSNIPIFEAGDLPLDEFGDLKGGSFNYDSLVSTEYNTAERMAFLEQVTYSTYENDALSKNHPKLRVGFADFTVTKGRYPRI